MTSPARNPSTEHPSNATFSGTGSGSAFSTGTASTSINSDDGHSLSEGDPKTNSGLYRQSFTSSTYNSPGILDYAGGEEDDEDGNALKNDSSSVINFYPDWCHCFNCLSRSNYIRPAHGWRQSIRYAFLCPPQGPVARVMSFLILIMLGWGFAWLLLLEIGEGNHFKAPSSPKGPITALTILLVLGLFTGITMKLFRLPSLLGPLVLGIFLRNIDAINIFVFFQSWNTRNCGSMAGKEQQAECNKEAINTSSNWIKPIRQIALTMILTRAGLELSPKQLRKLKGVVPMLAFGPCIVEACVCAGITYLLFNVIGDGDTRKEDRINIPMCFTAGFALAAVSPAVVVPGMLSLKRRNLGVAQGIPTLLIAASSIDDVLAISLYTICMGLALAGSDGSWKTFAAGPLSILVGTVHGFLIGAILHFIPARENKNKASTRLVLLLLFNFVSMFGYEESELLSGAGSLAVLVTSFIASFGWRSQPHWKRPMKQIEHTLALLWTLCVPLLFGTIGREIDFKGNGFKPDRVGKILGVIVISLAIRCFTAFMIVGITKLNFKERLFCALAWVPKATVQAALAPLVLSKIQDMKNNEKFIPHGQIVVTLAVLAILLTAPLGSVLIAIFGPRLLRTPTIPEQINIEEEFPNGDGVDPHEEVVVTSARRNRLSELPMMVAGSGSLGAFPSMPKGDIPQHQVVTRSASAGAILDGGHEHAKSFWDHLWF